MVFAPHIKQLFVASSSLLASLSVGGAVSYPTVLLHQLKRNDTTIPLDFEAASWIGAIRGLAGIPSILMLTIMQWKGRKITLILAYLISILGWVLAYTANSAWVLLASESFHGFGSNSYAVAYLSISEIAPAYRDLFIRVHLILGMLVMALNGLMIHYLHWKTISIIMCVPMVLTLVIVCQWPESLYWLAYKGEFRKCQEAFLWLRGSDPISDSELRELINAQKENISGDKQNYINSFKNYLNKIKSSDFYVPATHIFALQYLVYGISSIVLFIYSLELFQRATQNDNIAFCGSFIVNGSQLLGVAVTIIISRYLKKKTILLCSTFSATLSLTHSSAVSYLETTDSLAKEYLIWLYFIIIAYIVSLSLGTYFTCCILYSF